MTSTLPWKSRVMAFCHGTILRGSYVALRTRVCSMANPPKNSALRSQDCQGRPGRAAAASRASGRRARLPDQTQVLPRLFRDQARVALADGLGVDQVGTHAEGHGPRPDEVYRR